LRDRTIRKIDLQCSRQCITVERSCVYSGSEVGPAL